VIFASSACRLAPPVLTETGTATSLGESATRPSAGSFTAVAAAAVVMHARTTIRRTRGLLVNI
jgi:hypothetical protein